MCGRFTLDIDKRFYPRFRLANAILDIKPRYNIAPAQNVPVIKKKKLTENELEIMRWGLIPFWAKDPNIGYKMINARSETVLEKPSFKNSFKTKRCLVPATGFYEWEKQGSEKIPHYFHLKDKQYFAFAGLYDIWKDPEGNEIKTFTIITTKPNSLVSNIHDRMPVIIEEKDEQEWLMNDDLGFLESLLKSYTPKEMDEYVVSQKVNGTKNDSRELIMKTI